jgi:hypothetical protein
MSLDMLVFGLLALILVAAIIFAATGKRNTQEHTSDYKPSQKYGQMRDDGRNNFG